MLFKPHQYQTHAIEHLLNKPATALFFECGLGKTACVLTAIDRMLWVYTSKILVIAPLRVAETVWDEEIDKWDHLRHLTVSKVLGSMPQRLEALTVEANIYVINRENVHWLVDHYKRKWPFDMVVIDELSSFKSQKSRRFKELRKVRPYIDRVIGLTATPVPNGLIDLWSQMYLLDRGERLGTTIGGYRDRYFNIENNHRIAQKTYPTYSLKEGADEVIYSKISDICISLKSEDWLDTPKRIDNFIQVELSEVTRKLYKKLEKELLVRFDGGCITADTAGILSNKLLQMANGAVYDEDRNVRVLHDAKITALEDIIEASNGKPVLVFYAYKHDFKRILSRIKGSKLLLTAQDTKDWNTGRIPVMLTHPKSAGYGLNLQAGGHTIVWFGLTWSLEGYQQANGRIHRQGQQNVVIVHHLVAKDTWDEVVIQRVDGKTIGQDALLEAVQARIRKICA